MSQENILEEHIKQAEGVICLREGKLLGAWREKKYNQYITVCKVECKLGHIWNTFVERLKIGHWCKVCADLANRVPESEIKKLIESKDGTLLKDETIKGKRSITIRCNKDQHEWTAKLSAITSHKQWCKECHHRSKTKQVDIDEVKKYLFDRGLELRTPEAMVTFWSRIKIYCPKHNRLWETTYASMKAYNSSCKLCGHGTMGDEELFKILEANNVTFIKRLTGKGVSTVRNILLRCNKHNHEWTTNLTDIKVRDRWCYYCAREERKTQYPKIKSIVESKKGTLLTANCVGSLTKIMVRCENNHEFETYYDNINQGYWCPECPWITQALLVEIIRALFPGLEVIVNFRGFDWLRDINNLEIDIWIPALKLAIEYNGIQHFKMTKFSSNMTDDQALIAFNLTKKHDDLKDTLIPKHSDEIKHFVRLSYKDAITKENIMAILKSKGVPLCVES